MLKDVYKDNLDGSTWLGKVVDINDPQKIGRVRVNVFGKFDQIPISDIPWAYPGNNNTGGSSTGGGFLSVPKLNSIVSVRFDKGNLYHPEYFFNQQISDDVRQEIESSYENAHIIVYDTVTNGSVKIFFTEAKGIMLDYQSTQINIKPDKSVLIQTASGNSKAEILDTGVINITQADMINVTTQKDVNIKGNNFIIDHAQKIELGKGASEHLVLGDSFMDLFNKHQHIGNMGSPTSPPTEPMTANQHLSGKGSQPESLTI